MSRRSLHENRMNAGRCFSRMACALFLCALLCMRAFPLRAHAAPPLLIDEADLLSDSEEQELLSGLTEVSDRYNIDVAIYIAATLNGQDAQEFSDDRFVYDEYGRGETHDGVLFMQCPEERDYAFTQEGRADMALSDDALQEMEQAMLVFLREDNYAEAYRTYIDGVDRYMEYYEKYGVSFSYEDLETHEEDQVYLMTEPEEERTFFQKLLGYAEGNALLAPIAGVIGGLLYGGSKKRRLVNVRRQSGAGRYVSAEASKMRISRDILVNRTMTKTPIPRADDTRSSSGGRVGGTSTHHVHRSSGRTLGGRSGKY